MVEHYSDPRGMTATGVGFIFGAGYFRPGRRRASTADRGARSHA